MKTLKHENIKTWESAEVRVVFMFLCFYVFMFLFTAGAVFAQFTPPSIPPELGAVSGIGDLGLGALDAPSVEILVSASGVVGTTAALTANTENIDENTALFSWYVDDEVSPSASAKALTSFSFRATKQFHVVRLVISSDGKVITQDAVPVNSFSVSVIWHADTFVPADYEGKAMPTVGSKVTLVALPDIANEAPQDLLYTWFVNSESRVRNILGEREFSLTITKNVSFVPVVVEVSNRQGSVRVRQAVTVPVLKPMLALATDSARLVRQDMTGSVAALTTGETIILRAKPFYFHIASLSELAYRWSFLGRETLGIPPDPDVLTLTIPQDSGTGSNFLRARAENPGVPGESAEAAMEIIIL